ncbi:MAG: flagellar type III secretion system protein FlhB [Cypionkella sp.]|nr:flagellar type III secretion system protein FlhB [Cypionkella sp.]
MSDQEQDSAEKEHDPTPSKLDQARKEGDVAKSTDLMTGVALAGFLLVTSFSGNLALDGATEAQEFLRHAAAIAEAGAMAEASTALLRATALPALLLLLLPGLAALLSLVAQRGLVFAPARIKPRLSRISPLATAKQKFGAEGLFEFAKSLIKVSLIAGALVLVLQVYGQDILGSALLDPRQGTLLLLGILALFLAVSAGISLLIGAVDFLWQRHALMRRNRMSRRELQEEMRQDEGDPHAKAARRQKGQDMALNQMLAKVPNAAVVIVNPTHYAVALEWQRGSGIAPLVVAKGVDEVAMKIREAAIGAGVPLHSDPPTARALHATVRIGHPIDRRHFKAVAAALRFAERLKAKGRGYRHASR